MKFSVKIIAAFLAISLFIISCRNSDDPVINPESETKDLIKIKEFSNDTHTIELYSATGMIQQGYNDLKIRIKNKSTNLYEKNAEINWIPLMHMTSMTHSCPKSAVTKEPNSESLYSGYIVFQMPQNASEYWDLKVNYSISGTEYSATSVIDVPASAKTRVSSFLGSDNVKYVVAYVEPKTPKVAINDWIVGVWKMQDMMNFLVADGYTVKIDPRMPGMGNHGSPNNVNAVQQGAGKLYYGKLSLTMTGYWKLNLQLQKPDGTIVKGEEITDTNPASSLFFEIEF